MNREKKHFKRVFNQLLPLIIEELWDLLDEEKKRIWTRQRMLKRPSIGATNTLFKELQAEDPAEFRALLKMDVERFETLLNNIAPYIQRSDTMMGEAIPARIKLQIALTYLATGMSYRYLQAMFRTSRLS